MGCIVLWARVFATARLIASVLADCGFGYFVVSGCLIVLLFLCLGMCGLDGLFLLRFASFAVYCWCFVV